MRSRNSASGSRTGVKAKSPPSFAGVHLSIMIPFGTSMNVIRIGRAVAAASAGVMASSTGSANAAPAPRRKVRRGMDFLVIITIANPPHLKRDAFDDAENDGRPPLVIGGGHPRDLAKSGAIVWLHAATERIGQEPLGEGLHEQVPLAHQDIAQARRPIELGAVGQNAGRIDRPGSGPGGVAPPAETVEILQRKAE